KQISKSLALAPVPLLELAAVLAIVSFDGIERSIGNAASQKHRRCAEQRVPALNMVLEKRQRFAWFESLDPQVDLAEFDRHRVDVNAVQAVGDNLAQCTTHGAR